MTDYAKLPGINFSRLKHLRTSPLQFKHECEAEETDAIHFRIGLLTHCHLLEPDKVDERFALFTGKRRQGKAWDQAKEEHAGKRILTEPEWTRALRTAEAIRNHPVAAELLAQGLCEVPITWTDEETGVHCKGRPDHAGERLVDIKTTSALDPLSFSRQVVKLCYHGQSAFYYDGLVANGFDLHRRTNLIAGESDEPHDVVVYELPEHVVGLGRREYRRLLRLYAECLERDEWPGLAPDAPKELVLPEWAYTDNEEEPLTLTSGGKPMEF